MNTIGFIGAYDKTDFMLYIAKVMTSLGKKVLLVDTTVNQKARYIVPVINPTKSYITEFEGIDVAVGFHNYEEIKKYLSIPETGNFEYDIALLDIDSKEYFDIFQVKECQNKYFVTSFDLYSLKKGLEIISQMEEPIHLSKILFSKQILKEENEYLDYLSLDTQIEWNENIIYFPLDTGDQNVIIENQRTAKIKMRKLSQLYKESLAYLVEEILKEEPKENIKKAFRNIEKEV